MGQQTVIFGDTVLYCDGKHEKLSAIRLQEQMSNVHENKSQ